MQETQPLAAVSLLRANASKLLALMGNSPVSDVAQLRLVNQPDDSMEPTFSRGALLLLDTGVRSPSQDGVYLLAGPDDGMVRRLQRRIDGAWALLPDNPRYQAEVVPRDRKGDYRVVGRVVYAWSGVSL